MSSLGNLTKLALSARSSVFANEGTILRRNASEWEYLSLGTAGQFIRSDGTTFDWDDIQAGDLPAHTNPPDGAAGGDLDGFYPDPTVPGLALKEDKINKGQPNGYASLDSLGVVVEPVRFIAGGHVADRPVTGSFGEVYMVDDYVQCSALTIWIDCI